MAAKATRPPPRRRRGRFLPAHAAGSCSGLFGKIEYPALPARVCADSARSPRGPWPPAQAFDDQTSHVETAARCVRVSTRLAWTATSTTRQDAADLAELLEDLEEERPLGLPTGVWTVPDQ